ncbi:MAG: FHA domain-containing protein [Planctomycetota bacterium]|jgi:hypothetical protein
MLQLRQKDAAPEDAVVLTKKTVIGSHELADFVIAGAEGHSDVWPTHCVISKAGSKFLLMALDPHAEVLVNGDIMQQGAVKLGDVITIGGFEITVEEAHTEVGEKVDALLKRTQDEAKRQAERKSRRLEKRGSQSEKPEAAAEKDDGTGKRKLTRRYKKQENPFGLSNELDEAFGEDAAAAKAEAEKLAADFGLPPIDGGGFGTTGGGMPELPVAGDTKLPAPAPEPEPEEISPVADAIAARVEADSGRAAAVKQPVDEADDDLDLVSPDDPLLLPKDDLPKRTAKKRKTKTIIKGKRTASGRMQAVGKDGKLDVDASIRAHSKRVSARELAKKADTVRILNYSTIKGLIDDAVAEAMNLVGAKLDDKERKALLKEAEDEFKARLEGFKAEKAGLEAQAANLRAQLEKASSVLEEERGREVQSSAFTVSEKGMEDLEENFMRMLRNAVKGEGIPKSLQAQLEGMISSLLDNEREKIAEQAKRAQSEAIALLEKKVKRLAGGLEEAEAERDRQARRAQALAAQGGKGVASVMDAGLEEDDPDKERKLELLRAVFEQNKALRESLGETVASFEEVAAKAEARTKALKEKKARELEELRREMAEDEGSDAAGDDEPEQAEEEEAEGLAPEDDPYADLIDPDDEVWQPGMSFATEAKGDDELEDEETDVKKFTNYKKFEPPPLERKK